MLCGADPAGRPTAFCAAAGPGVKPGKTAQDGATKGPPWRFVSGRWEARRHHRQRQGRACPVPIRRAVPLLPVLLPGRTPGREGQPRTERRKGRPCALSVNAGRPVDTTGSGRAGLVRCRSGGQAHCFLCCCRAGRQAGKDSPGRSDERAALALCQLTLGGTADTTDSDRTGLVRCRSGRQSHCFLCCCRFGRRCRKGTPGRSDERAVPWDALSVDAGRPVDTAESGRAIVVRCRSGGQSHCFLCCCRAGRQAGKDSPGRSDERAALALCQWTLGGLWTLQRAAGPIACPVPIRRAVPLLSVLSAGSGADAGKAAPGRSEERAALALCQWTLGGPPTPQTAAGPGLSGADPARRPTAFRAAAEPGAKPGRTAHNGATNGPPWRFVSGRWEARRPPQTAAGPGLSGADPAGRPTAFCAAAGSSADAGMALQDGAM